MYTYTWGEQRARAACKDRATNQHLDHCGIFVLTSVIAPEMPLTGFWFALLGNHRVVRAHRFWESEAIFHQCLARN